MAENGFHRALIGAMQYVPEIVVWRFSKRYIAGKKIQDAYQVVRALNSSGCSATIGRRRDTRRNSDARPDIDRARQGYDQESKHRQRSLRVSDAAWRR